MQPELELAIRGTDRRIPLRDGARVTIGRAAECDVRLDDVSVSRHHCTLEMRAADLVVIDLQSANGTFVNERLVRSGSARPGDVVRVGNTELELVDRATAGGEVLARVQDERRLEAVIRRQFDPARLEWLATVSGGLDTGSGAIELVERVQRHLGTLHRVSEILSSARDLDALADASLGAILDVTGADRAALVLRRFDPDLGSFEVAAWRARVRDPERFTVSRPLVADVIEMGVSTFACDAINDARFNHGKGVAGQRVRSVMCVPLRTAEDILGAIYVDSLSEPGKFSEVDLELLAALGNQAGVALHRVRLMGELERLLVDAIRAIAATIDAKDGYTHRHSERVAGLARRVAREIGLAPDEQRTAELAALLHDVGKIAVPDTILNKPGRLSPEEFEEMKKHPLHGARILSNMQSASVAAVLPGVQHHHERWDGTGYPAGLRGEEIPILGRVLGAADFFDALTSARAYRAPCSVDEALALLQRDAGTHFDPQVVEAMVRLHGRGELLPSLEQGPELAGADLKPLPAARAADEEA